MFDGETAKLVLCFFPPHAGKSADKGAAAVRCGYLPVVFKIAPKPGSTHLWAVLSFGPAGLWHRNIRGTWFQQRGRHLLPVTVRPDNNGQALILLQLSRALFKVLHISVEIKSGEERAVGERVHGSHNTGPVMPPPAAFALLMVTFPLLP